MSVDVSVPGRALLGRFRVWRRSRPFGAGLLCMLGGLTIVYLPYADLALSQVPVRMATAAGAGSLVIGVLLITLGLTLWLQPLLRVFAGVAVLVLALVSLPMSNLGGLLVGFLLALCGAALSLAWAPSRASITRR